MRIEPPEPTRAEALALIVGSAFFCVLWGIGFGTVRRHPAVGGVALVFSMCAWVWTFVGGVMHVHRRAAHAQGHASGWPGRYLNGGPDPFFHMRVTRPSYYSRAAQVLGWNKRVVGTVLIVLLLIDLTVLAIAGSTPS